MSLRASEIERRPSPEETISVIPLEHVVARLLLDNVSYGEQLLLGELLISSCHYNTSFVRLKTGYQGDDLLEELALVEERLLRVISAFDSYEKSSTVINRQALFERSSELLNGLREENKRFRDLLSRNHDAS